MMNINIDISNTLIGSYSLNAVYSKVQIIFSGIPEEWQGNRIYATFVQDNLDPTVEVIDNAVSVPLEILKTGTDFYVSVYSIAYGSSQVSEPSSPILITVDTTKSSDINVEELIKTIMQHNATIRSLSEVALTGSYNNLKDIPNFAKVAMSGSYLDLIDKLILSGSSKNSIQSFNAKEAIGEGSIALGPGAVAGCRGYYIKSVDINAKKIYLTDTQTQPVISEDDNTDESFESPKYEIGQEFVTVNSNHYFSKDAIIKSVYHNVIEYEGAGIGYKSFVAMAKSERDPHDFSFFVPKQPTIGCAVIKPGGFAAGYEVLVPSKYGFGAGYRSIVFGNYGVALGRMCMSGGSAFSAGQECYAIANESLAIGLRLWALLSGQSVFGKYNKLSTTLAHMIGNGSSDSKRSNCHELKFDGTGWYAKKLRVGGSGVDDENALDVATEKYVNEKSEIAGGVGKWSLTSRIDGVSAGFKISFLYPVDFTSWHVYLEGKDISGALPPNKTFITAPLIFNDLSKITITLDNNGTELLSMRMNNIVKNNNIQIGNLLVKED